MANPTRICQLYEVILDFLIKTPKIILFGARCSFNIGTGPSPVRIEDPVPYEKNNG